MSDFKEIVSEIESATGHTLSSFSTHPVSGGSINDSYKLSSDNHDYFIKLNKTSLVDMFEAEASGLIEFEKLNCVRVPKVICYGIGDDHSFIAMEYIELGNLDRKAGKLLGEQLAEIHHQSQPFFGWHRDNTIGSTPQHNDREHNWQTFWQRQRLDQQLTFAKRNGFAGSLAQKGNELIDKLPDFFADYTPNPCLLHGDLWGGNAAADTDGNPVIFDPATYYGDRETDIAMTELFGGFGSDFYDAYQASFPLDHGYKIRKTLYNLYHILNHLNLFGGGYLGQAETMIDQLLAEVIADMSAKDRFMVDSAGTHAYHVGEQSDPRSRQTAKTRGVDLSQIRARKVAAADFEHFDHVLAMDSDNYHNLMAICPNEYQHKVELFLDYAENEKETDVPDPYYGGPNGFEHVFDLVEEASKGLYHSIMK